MKKAISNLLQKHGLYGRAYKTYYGSRANIRRVYDKISNRNEKHLKSYTESHSVKKLHLGCGKNYLDGWVNTDFWPDSKAIYLDITRRFTFEDNTFDYIFTEHVIEHVPYLAGKNLLQESFRVLKPGGTLRVVTPDINFLIGLYQDSQKDLHRDYIKWNSGLFIRGNAPHTALSVFNNFVRDWGHKYIYDIATLRAEMENCGFIDIATPALNESMHEPLRNIEHDSRHPNGFLALESLVIEGTKPR